MEKVTLKKQAAEQIRKGYPMIVNQDFARKPQSEEGDLIELVDSSNRFVSIAYLGKEKRAAGWVLSRKKEWKLDDLFLKELFKQAKDYRKTYFIDEGTTAFRLLNGEGEGLGGMVIDYYDGYALFQWYNRGIYAYKDLILKNFWEVFPEVKGIYEKVRFSTNQKKKSDFVSGERAPEPLIVKENGVKYATYLDDGLMTGIFLDQRHVRRTLMEEYSAGKNVLNLFSYTGAFSLAAAMGGAMKTVSIDVANRSLPKTKEQFQLNGIDSDLHEIRVIDVFDYIQYALRHELLFDVIVSDPPTFARTKKRTFNVEQDYEELIQQYIDLTTEDGVIVLSTNARKMTREEFKEIIHQAFKKKNQAYTIIEEFGLPEDFVTGSRYSEGNYLKVYFVRKN